MSGSLSHAARAEPNLTPILDMVFQLITFFMLVINFKSAAMDLSLRLPVVGSAQPVDTKGTKDLLVLNVNQEGKLVVYGGVKEDVDGYIKLEAQASRIQFRRQYPNLREGDELPTIVVIRADEATPFKYVNKVISLCQNEGFRNFALKAMNKRVE